MSEQLEQAARQALESLNELVADPECDFGPSYALQQDRQKKAITALRAALKQPAQDEPFGYFRYDMRLDAWVQNREGKRPGTPFYTRPQPVPTNDTLQEPVDETAKQRHEPLTNEAIWRTYKHLWMFHPAEEPRLAGDILKFARAIEAAHGIGENT